MKQIEREGSSQRTLCAILGALSAGLTIADLAELRGVNASAIGRQLRRLAEQGFVRSEGHPRRWFRTDATIPEVKACTRKSAAVVARRRREEEVVCVPFRIPPPSEIERVFLAWQETHHAD
jgi:hypothetical protein